MWQETMDHRPIGGCGVGRMLTLRGDHFDQNAMLALIERGCSNRPITAGYSRTRLLAHMEWGAARQTRRR